MISWQRQCVTSLLAAPTILQALKAQLATSRFVVCIHMKLVATQAPASGNKLNRSTALKCVAPLDSDSDSDFDCQSPTHSRANNNNNNNSNSNNSSNNNKRTGAKINYAQFANSTLELKSSSCYLSREIFFCRQIITTILIF